MPQLDIYPEQLRVLLRVDDQEYPMISMAAQGEQGEQGVFRKLAEHRFTPPLRRAAILYDSISTLSTLSTLSGVDIISKFSEQGGILTPDHPEQRSAAISSNAAEHPAGCDGERLTESSDMS